MMDYKLIGSPCGEHGPYTFYKAFKYTKNGQTNILGLCEFFFVKLWTDSDLISIGELQLLWEDKNSEQTLASLRLYILPENTPDGRCDFHGEDEVLAITEKVVIRLEDLLTWITQATDWHWGLGAVWERDCPQASEDSFPIGSSPLKIDMEDIKKEKQMLDASHWETNTGVVVLSYARYCRYRGILKRLEGVHDKWLRTGLVAALGGFTAPCKNTRVLFCKETFDYPDLEGHELLCNHLAPKLKGRPRRKRKKQKESSEGTESESESSQSTSSSTSKAKVGVIKPRLRCTLDVPKRTIGPSLEERNFNQALHHFMNERKTPIGRIPVVGFKEVNLYVLFKKVTELGGYDIVTAGKLWKHVYEVMGGDMGSTSAATLSRRHYEKLLLPYERHLKGQPLIDEQITKIKNLPSITVSAAIKKEDKNEIKPTIKSSLRSIRHKQEKGGAAGVVEKENIPQTEKAVPATSPQVPPPSVKKEPEVVDLVSDEPPVKAMLSSSLSPLLKKQKLEILKEGGLEVTPIGVGGRASVIKSGHNPGVPPISMTPAQIKPNPPSKLNPPPRPSPSPSNQGKISITVTPDMSHLMYPPGPSKRPIYGNPKEPFVTPPKKTPLLHEVLDLRMKPKGTSLNIGSNLEITIVPQSKQTTPRSHLRSPVPSAPQPINPAHLSMAPPKKRPPPMPAPRAQIIPQPRAAVPKMQPRYPLHAQGMKGPHQPYHHLHPAIDPSIYFSALYNGIFAYPSPQAQDIYKELIRRQGYPLLQDGSTSITLVGQTPTSK